MKQHDVVELLIDIPERGLVAGALGTVLEDDKPGIVLVEFDPTDKDEFPVLSVASSALCVRPAARDVVHA